MPSPRPDKWWRGCTSRLGRFYQRSWLTRCSVVGDSMIMWFWSKPDHVPIWKYISSCPSRSVKAPHSCISIWRTVCRFVLGRGSSHINLLWAEINCQDAIIHILSPRIDSDAGFLKTFTMEKAPARSAVYVWISEARPMHPCSWSLEGSRPLISLRTRLLLWVCRRDEAYCRLLVWLYWNTVVSESYTRTLSVLVHHLLHFLAKAQESV